MIRAQHFDREAREWAEHDAQVAAEQAAWDRADRLADFTPAQNLAQGAEPRLSGSSLDAAGGGSLSDPPHPLLHWPEHDRHAAYERAEALREASQVAERVRPARPDDLDAARGLALGVVISSVFWLLVAAVVAAVIA